MTNLEEHQYSKLVARSANGILTVEQENLMNELGKQRIKEMTAANNEPEKEVLGESGYNYEWDLKNNSIERLGSSD